MSSSKRAFDESLLSGFLDGVLTQSDEQKVRLHLEDSVEARRVLDELRSVRALTLDAEFASVPDDQWDERPRGAVSRTSFRMGWVLMSIWLVVCVSVGLWLFAVGPDHLLSKVLVFTGLSGVGLLFLSVLTDRIRRLRSDRYRGVER